MVALGIELSTIRLSAEPGQPALDYLTRLPTAHDILEQFCGALLLRFSSPCGSRTQPGRIEKPMTSPEVERAKLLRASSLRSGPGGARILVCGSSDRR